VGSSSRTSVGFNRPRCAARIRPDRCRDSCSCKFVCRGPFFLCGRTAVGECPSHVFDCAWKSCTRPVQASAHRLAGALLGHCRHMARDGTRVRFCFVPGRPVQGLFLPCSSPVPLLLPDVLGYLLEPGSVPAATGGRSTPAPGFSCVGMCCSCPVRILSRRLMEGDGAAGCLSRFFQRPESSSSWAGDCSSWSHCSRTSTIDSGT
jgi:hypothetical protein